MVSDKKSLLLKPVLLDAAHFTPLARTPWAGQALASGIKSSFVASQKDFIGEAWEFSCDPEFPSYLEQDSQLTLAELIDADPSKALSPGLVNSGRCRSDILVKLINASSPLSLQIHPQDGHPALKQKECGKPESWLVLDAEPGAGLYLGFSRALQKTDISHHLKNNTFQKDWLQFVTVQKGDFFEIGPGVPHAIGPGLVLLEPQRIAPGLSGKTWRMWDWNRLYDSSGQQAPQGSPRALHIDESLSLLEPGIQVGLEYVESLRRRPQKLHTLHHHEILAYPANDYYQVFLGHTSNSHPLHITTHSHYGIFTLLEGTGEFVSGPNLTENLVAIKKGQTAFIPFGSLPLSFFARTATCKWTLVIPADNKRVHPVFG